MPSGPVAALKLSVIERQGRGFRVFEPRVQPVLSEQPEEMYTAYAACAAPLRKKVRSKPVANATARTTLSTGIVPIKLSVEPEVTARKEVAVDVAEAKVGIEPCEAIRSLLGAGGIVSECRVEWEDRVWILAQG